MPLHASATDGPLPKLGILTIGRGHLLALTILIGPDCSTTICFEEPMVCRLTAGAEWIRTSSSAPDRQQFRSFVRDGHALLGAATCQPRRDEAAAKIARRVGASDLKRVLSPVAAAEVIPTEARQAFEHAGGTADRKIALLTQGYGVIRVLRPI